MLVLFTHYTYVPVVVAEDLYIRRRNKMPRDVAMYRLARR